SRRVGTLQYTPPPPAGRGRESFTLRLRGEQGRRGGPHDGGRLGRLGRGSPREALGLALVGNARAHERVVAGRRPLHRVPLPLGAQRAHAALPAVGGHPVDDPRPDVLGRSHETPSAAARGGDMVLILDRPAGRGGGTDKPLLSQNAGGNARNDRRSPHRRAGARTLPPPNRPDPPAFASRCRLTRGG